jgi:hypothetical protein
VGVEGSCPGKRSGKGVRLTTQVHLSQRFRMASYSFTLPLVFMAWCLIKRRENLTFAFEGTEFENVVCFSNKPVYCAFSHIA